MSSAPTSQLTSPTTTEAPSIVTVDPGQVIRINARFPGDPASVRFSFMSPQTKGATHDSGALSPDSKIQNIGDLYCYDIDTRNMRGGLGWWYFFSDDEDPSKRRAKVGRFIVRDVPLALLTPGEVVVGADEKPASRALWPWVVGSGAAGLLVGALVMRTPTESVTEAATELPAAAPVRALPPRSSSGKFLSAAEIAAQKTELTADETSTDLDAAQTDSDASPSMALVAVGALALGAFGYWLWRDEKNPSAVQQDGLDLLGTLD
jgi:hypothetical protein